jgi:hypothetical protein
MSVSVVLIALSLTLMFLVEILRRWFAGNQRT